MTTATTTQPQVRMSQPPVMLVPGALQAMYKLHEAVGTAGLPKTTLELVNLRASQINGCSFCSHMHAAALRKEGNADEKIDTVAAWQESPFFGDAERAALALTEHLTRVADRSGEAVPDEVWDEVADHYSEAEVAALLVSIAAIQVWNRLNAANRQPAGSVPV